MPNDLIDIKDYVLPVFSGDFALLYPYSRQVFDIGMAEEWGRMLDTIDTLGATA